MSIDRVILSHDPTIIGAYQIITDYGNVSLTPTAARRVLRWLKTIIGENDGLPEDDDPSEGFVPNRSITK